MSVVAFVQCDLHPIHLAIFTRQEKCLQTMLERLAELWTSIKMLKPQKIGDAACQDALLLSAIAAAKDGSKLLSSPDLTQVALPSTRARLQLATDPEEIPDYVTLPLHSAVFADDMEALALLLDNGADVDQAGPKYYYTPLHAAISHENVNVVKKLIDAGANTQLCDDHGLSCQQLMMFHRSLQDIASPDLALDGPATDIYGQTLVEKLAYSPTLWRLRPPESNHSLGPHESFDWKKAWDTLDYLLNSGLDISSTTTAFGGILHNRWTDNDVKNVRLEIVKLLVYAGATASYRGHEQDGKVFSVYQKARHFPEIQRWLLVER